MSIDLDELRRDEMWDDWRKDQAAKRGVFCEDCGEVVNGASECVALGVDPDAPRCRWCCMCTDCAMDLRKDLDDAQDGAA